MATVEEQLLTIEEYAKLPDDGRRTELVQGRIVEMPPTNFLHGITCGFLSRILGNWVAERQLGWITTNDSGIITQREPDSVRGADVAYYSYARVPGDSIPQRYPQVAPDLVIEVKSPSDRWRDLHAKVAEYLAAGVLIVCVIDPVIQTAWLYYLDQADRMVGPDGDLTFPECLPGLSIPMRSFYL